MTSITRQPWFPRALPFIVYMAFILVEGLLSDFLPKGGHLQTHLAAIIYPVKTIAVVIALAWAWPYCDELNRESLKLAETLLSVGVGVLVFVLWINITWTPSFMGEPTVYDPTTLSAPLFYGFVAIRLLGASVVVPIFEEIFWRSLILRYIIDPDFIRVKIGQFTWASFLLSSVLFGSEHFLLIAGIVAGIFYNLLIYKTRSVWQCIIAHGVTNFLLGVYVLQSKNWFFW